MESDKLQSIIESVLFVSGEPIKKSKLAKIVGEKIESVEENLEKLSQKYLEDRSGLMIIFKGEEVQLVSKADNLEFVENLVKSELQDALSQSSLEVLSIIAYRGPVSKVEIEQIRGVNCSYTLRNLLLRGLIERSDNPRDSRGWVYSVSFDLLKKFGIDNVNKLPDYATLSVDSRMAEIAVSEEEVV